MSPLLHEIPSHHASTYITVAGMDPLREEGIAYAQHLNKYGVDAQLDVVPGVPHGITVAPEALVAKQFFRDQARMMNANLNATW
jgi:acetyl esterase/lipase